MQGSVNCHLKEKPYLVLRGSRCDYCRRLNFFRYNEKSPVSVGNSKRYSARAFVETVQKSTAGRRFNGPTMKYYLKYRCPKPVCAFGVVPFLDKAGCTNPNKHLKYCYAKDMSKAAEKLRCSDSMKKRSCG